MYSAVGTWIPASAWIGSTMKAAKRRVASRSSSASSEPKGTLAVPGSIGPKPSLQKESLIRESAPQVRP